MIVSFAIQENECLSICPRPFCPSKISYHLLHIGLCLIIDTLISWYFTLFITIVNRLIPLSCYINCIYGYIEKYMCVWIYIHLLILVLYYAPLGFPGNPGGKESAYNAEDLSSISRLGRSSGEGNGNPLQCSYLENPKDSRVWRVTVHGVTKSWTQLSY